MASLRVNFRVITEPLSSKKYRLTDLSYIKEIYSFEIIGSGESEIEL
jgi:hypothetical protein